MAFGAYVALGDSMSIDRYPDLDHSERQRTPLPATGLGAASLLARNDDVVWPEFSGRDLVTRHPGIECRLLAADGATTETVIASQLETIAALDPRSATLITLTAGGNDLLALLGASESEGRAGVRQILENLEAIVAATRKHLPRATVLVANVYDPTDGTGDLESTRLRAREMRWLDDFNAGVERLCHARETRLIDLHRHFAGHGRSAPAHDRWYWSGSLIEPGVVGASEIRRRWLAALDDRPRGRRRR
jgi:lysophospholipase L1-like esterase